MPTPTLNVSPRFGVEIEFMGPATGAEVVNELRKIGIEAADVGYTHSVVDYWKVVPDSSCGLELVSPPLYWHQRLDVRRAMLALQRVKAEVDVNCGFHVHHEWPWKERLTQAEIDERLTRLRGSYRTLEPLLRALLPPSRWDDNRFCAFGPVDPNSTENGAGAGPYEPGPIRQSPICPECGSRNCQWCADCEVHACDRQCLPDCDYEECDGDDCGGMWTCDHFDRDDDGDAIGHANIPIEMIEPGEQPENLHRNRYQAVNFVSVKKYGTVEFRQHQGTLNPSKALAWIELTRNVVHAASRPMEMADRFDFIFEKLSTSTWANLAARCSEDAKEFEELIEQARELVSASSVDVSPSPS